MISGKELKEAKELSIEANITMAEALNFLIQMEWFQLLRQGFVILSNDEHPTGLEAIALALGYK